MVFRKNLRSLERRWEKISKFLGDLPSEQIFYRNIPLGALDLAQANARCEINSNIAILIGYFFSRDFPNMVLNGNERANAL